jgi:hypothetical protein
MNRWLRVLASVALLALLLTEFGRYRAEWQLAEASVRLERVLRGVDRDAAASAAVERASNAAQAAAQGLPHDMRPVLFGAIAAILQQRSEQAATMLEAAIARGERPELTLNLGRARTALRDDAAADRAYLRTAWASRAAIATLPKAMRETLDARVAQLENDLRDGRLSAPPPLD